MIICTCDPKDSRYDAKKNHCAYCGRCAGSKMTAMRNNKIIKTCNKECLNMFDDSFLFPVSGSFLTKLHCLDSNSDNLRFLDLFQVSLT